MSKHLEEYLIDYTNGKREIYKDLKEFYDKYMEIKKNKQMNTVSRWCSVDFNCHISPLSSYGLYYLFLRASEPENGYVICQYMDDVVYYKVDDSCMSKDLKKALILTKEVAEREMRINRLYKKMIKCSIRERDLGKFDN